MWGGRGVGKNKGKWKEEYEEKEEEDISKIYFQQFLFGYMIKETWQNRQRNADEKWMKMKTTERRRKRNWKEEREEMQEEEEIEKICLH